MRMTKTLWGILLFNIAYLIFFAFHFFQRGNFEFIWYIFIMTILIVLVSLLHRKYNFTILTLIGVSIWGIGHMLGGSTLLTEPRLYVQVIYPFFTSGDVTILSYDHVMHFYFYMVATAMLYQVIKKYIRKDAKWLPVAVLILFTSMGIGAFNEIVEFMPVLFLAETGVGGYFNIAWDLVFNTLGALVTIVYLTFWRKINKL
jgi:uncharacterized membrane protein YjdF